MQRGPLAHALRQDRLSYHYNLLGMRARKSLRGILMTSLHLEHLNSASSLRCTKRRTTAIAIRRCLAEAELRQETKLLVFEGAICNGSMRLALTARTQGRILHVARKVAGLTRFLLKHQPLPSNLAYTPFSMRRLFHAVPHPHGTPVPPFPFEQTHIGVSPQSVVGVTPGQVGVRHALGAYSCGSCTCGDR